MAEYEFHEPGFDAYINHAIEGRFAPSEWWPLKDKYGTPTTQQVRAIYAVIGRAPDPELVQEFDRWLAQVKAATWDEGYQAGASFNGGLGEYIDESANPYREQTPPDAGTADD